MYPLVRCLLSSASFLLRQVLRQRTASITEAQRGAQSAQAERAAVEERLRALQRAVAMLETEKKDAERQAVRLEKDKEALRNTLDKVSNSKKKKKKETPTADLLFLLNYSACEVFISSSTWSRFYLAATFSKFLPFFSTGGTATAHLTQQREGLPKSVGCMSSENFEKGTKLKEKNLSR